MRLLPVPLLKSCFCCCHNEATAFDIINCCKHKFVDLGFSVTRVCDEWESDDPAVQYLDITGENQEIKVIEPSVEE